MVKISNYFVDYNSFFLHVSIFISTFNHSNISYEFATSPLPLSLLSIPSPKVFVSQWKLPGKNKPWAQTGKANYMVFLRLSVRAEIFDLKIHW